MLVLITSVLYVGVGVLEIIPLLKDREKKKLFIYLFFMTLAAVLSILLELGIKITSPAEIIEGLLKYIQKVGG